MNSFRHLNDIARMASWIFVPNNICFTTNIFYLSDQKHVCTAAFDSSYYMTEKKTIGQQNLIYKLCDSAEFAEIIWYIDREMLGNSRYELKFGCDSSR